MKLLQPFLCGRAFYGLGLVDDQYRVGLGDDVDGATAAKLVQPHIDAARVLPLGVERLGVNDHHVDGAVRSKPVDLRQLGGVIDEKPDLLPIFLGEMLLGHLEGFVHALPNGDTGHHHNELAPAIRPVQLIHGLDIGVGLANARFHLDGQVIPALQPRGRRDLILPLDLLDMVQDDPVAQLRHNPLISPAGGEHFLAPLMLRASPLVD